MSKVEITYRTREDASIIIDGTPIRCASAVGVYIDTENLPKVILELHATEVSVSAEGVIVVDGDTLPDALLDAMPTFKRLKGKRPK